MSYIEVFKLLNGYENIDRNVFFSLKKDSSTRGHEATLVKDQSLHQFNKVVTEFCQLFRKSKRRFSLVTVS